MQGYQGQYQADGGYQTTYSADSAAQPAGAQFSQVQPPAYQSTDYNAAAAFHGQQGAFAGQAHQQL